jgi:Zn-dependent peptidase ImmA (M78 family)
MFTEVTYAELATVLDQIIAELFEQTAVIAPPINALQLAVRLNYRIVWDQRQHHRARVVKSLHSAAEQVILLKPEPRAERRQWAVAHELGEGLAWQVFERLDQDPQTARPQLREQVANWLAARILVPTAWLASSASESDNDLLLLKRKFSTASHELIARRLLDLDQTIAVTIFDQGTMVLRQASGGRRAPPWSALERDCWQQACEEITLCERTGPPRIRAWPLHEPGWLREIVLTEYPPEPEW